MRSMNEETSYIVWKAARRGFRYIQRMLSRTGAYGDVQVGSPIIYPKQTKSYLNGFTLALCAKLPEIIVCPIGPTHQNG